MKQVIPSESLLSAPGANSSVRQIERSSGPPVKIAEGFVGTTFRPKASDGSSPNFSRQYAHAYAVRLWAMRPTLEEGISREWKQTGVKKISELCESSGNQDSSSTTTALPSKNSPVKRYRASDDHGQHIAMREDIVVAVIGTIFKQQPEKPSILQELVEDNPMVPVKPKSRYISDKDVILLEDETTRVQLVPIIDCEMTIDGLVNGVVCAVRGRPTINGKFEVNDVLFATPKPCVWPSIKTGSAEMIFLSGLLLGTSQKHLAYLDLLFDYLQGLSGCPDEHEENLKTKTRVFILGDSFGSLDSAASPALANFTTEKEKEKNSRNDKIEVAKKLDNILNELSQTMEVFIIPGDKDPSESMFPQAPIHRCIFPMSSKRSTFHSMCNPTRLSISASISSSKTEKKKKADTDEQSIDIVLTSGQAVQDAIRNTDIDDPLDMSQKLLEWGHLCPTAPDTIPLHPGIQDDIFVLKTLPNLFVIGNQNNFGLKEWKKTKIVTVPKFADTGVAVVLNREFDIVPLTFKLT